MTIATVSIFLPTESMTNDKKRVKYSGKICHIRKNALYLHPILPNQLFSMKKLALTWVVVLAAVLAFSGCASKQVAYFQNIDTLNLSASRMLYDARIMPKDQLSIIVKATNEEASKPFNLYSSSMGSSQNQNQQYYLVDNEGNIDFPVIGKLHVLGLTSRECEDLVRNKISPYLAASEHPLVSVRMASFRVVVMGEVSSPGVVTVPNEKMSVVEALAESGDLGLQGKRKNIMLIREDATGKKEVHRLDLTDANVFNSPYFYLQQNDIVYVEPNGAKKGTAGLSNSITFWIGLTSSIISLATLIVSFTK